jgi:hypothetical protein
MKSCVAIDPSINNLGLAIFFDDELTTYDLIHPASNLTNEKYTLRARDMMNKVRAIYNKAKEYDSKIVLVTEIPEHFGDGGRGYIARETGAILKLSFVCGMICGITEDTVAYEPSKWKGQMSKEIVRARLIRTYPKIDIEHMDHNIMDSIGIGRKFIFGSV